MTRRFDIGPLLTALGAAVLLVALFLDWYGRSSAWSAFEVVDVLLAALAVLSLITALGLLVPEVATVEKRWLGWLTGAVVVVVCAELINPPPVVADTSLGLGAWLAFAAACAMLVGVVLTLSRVSFAVSVEGRDQRRRVAAVDHRPPPTETGIPVTPSRRATEPLLGRREAGSRPEPPEA
jgi:hypothetical protein